MEDSKLSYILGFHLRPKSKKLPTSKIQGRKKILKANRHQPKSFENQVPTWSIASSAFYLFTALNDDETNKKLYVIWIEVVLMKSIARKSARSLSTSLLLQAILGVHIDVFGRVHVLFCRGVWCTSFSRHFFRHDSTFRLPGRFIVISVLEINNYKIS